MRWSGPHYAKALYDFQAQTSTELSLQAGDVVLVTDNVDADWLLGETLYGSSGTFPANYVDEISLPHVRMDQRLFVALVDFLAERSGDLDLAKGMSRILTNQQQQTKIGTMYCHGGSSFSKLQYIVIKLVIS